MRKLAWKKWWRAVDGEVKQQEGFAFDDDPDTFYFDIDPERQAQPLADGDPRVEHVDSLHKTEESASWAARVFIERELRKYRQRMQKIVAAYKETLEQKKRRQFYDYLSGLSARIRFGNGGGSNLEVAVQPDVSSSEGRGGVFLYMIDNGGQEFHEVGTGVIKTPRREHYVRLTPKNARRLAHALLFLAGESEVHEQDDEILTPSHED